MRYLISLLVGIFLFSCVKTEKEYILISKDSNNRIENWLLQADSSLSIKVFYSLPIDSMDYYLNRSAGIIIGGGEDIHPSIYGKDHYVEVCGAFDMFRDSIELLMIGYALQQKVPLLGICRGHQIINASNGGTLIPDIPAYLETEINHRSQSDSAHVVVITKKSWLNEIGLDTLWVNSRHHQCIDFLSPEFSVAAISPDGIVESIQISDSNIHPFAVGIQWHPEGLLDIPSMLIAKQFINKSLAD